MRPRSAAPGILDAETTSEEAPGQTMQEVRLWLRMLTCTKLIEAEIRQRLRLEFGMTLPRFDFMAQLDRGRGAHGMTNGMTLGDVSRRMMVSNGNVTQLSEKLEADGLIRRSASPLDQRAVLVELTDAGHRLFARAAAAHAGWLGALLAGLDDPEVAAAMAALARVKSSVHAALFRPES